MFTEGLDPNAVRWVREGQYSYLANHDRTNGVLRGFRNGTQSRGLGIPLPEKFRSGHLPRASTIPVRVEDFTDSGSDMDESSDAEVIHDNGWGSLDSSPQDAHLESRTSKGNGVPQVKFQTREELSGNSSSKETMRKEQEQWKQNGFLEPEESSDSGGSLGFSRSSAKEDVGVELEPRGSNIAESPLRNLRVQKNVDIDLEQDNFPSAPSAPPFLDCGLNANKGAGTTSGAPTSRSCYSPSSVISGKSSTQNGQTLYANSGKNMPKERGRSTSLSEAPASSGSLPIRVPTFHASAQGPWHSVIAYDACVRLCLHSWARGCPEAPGFLENECALLRNAFGLKQILLQSEEELLAKQSSELVAEDAGPKPKKIIGKMKVQVRKVRMAFDAPTGCSFSNLKSPVIKLDSLRYRLSNLRSTISAGCASLKNVRSLSHMPSGASFSRHSLAYMHASTEYIKQVSGILKMGVTSLRSSSYEVVQETYPCLLRLKSLPEVDTVKMQPGTGETHLFFPDSLGDDLIVEVHDSKGKYHGRVVVQLASIAENPSDKLRWWSIYHEPDHELVGRVQLYVNYMTSSDESNSLKCGSIAETVAYDIVLETAMKIQQFQQRRISLHGEWKWLLTEFASYYGLSDAYTKLRYLSYVMDVATPTADCLTLVHDLLFPVILKSRTKNVLSHQENRILGEIEEQVDQILATVFENYKSLDESLLLGMVEVFRPASGSPAAALVPAVKLYTLLHDVLSPEAQLKLCSYFQAAVKKRSRRHLVETDEFVATGTEGTLWDELTLSTAYQKIRGLCLSIRNEIFTDIEIHNQHMLPSFINLPNISASIYGVELCSRLRAFLVACPPTGPSPHVVDLVIATSDFQRDLASWNLCPVKGGVDAKELFHLYIVLWIQDKRLSLLEACRLDVVKWSGVRTQHLTTPFVDDMYDRLKDTMNEYDVIICRWPEYTFVLENAVADIEKAVLDALEKQYADVLAPLKESLGPKKFGLKYVQKLAKRSTSCPFVVSDELGILLNSMKRLLDVLWPKIDVQLKSRASCIPDGGTNAAGERLNEVTVTLRAKFRNYVQAVVEKLIENTRLQNSTKLKKIIQDSRDVIAESDIRSRAQLLREQVAQTVDQLHSVFEVHVFIAVCRGYWDRMGQEVLNFLENRKDNRSLYKAARVTVSVLDDTVASQMQQLLGNSMHEKDLEPPRSILEVRSVLCRDVPNQKDSNFYY